MREILFRGKLPSGAWVYGDLRQYPSGVKAIRSDEWGHMMGVFPDTVGQYTGLNDNNGTKIFEGDIIRAAIPATVGFREYVWPLMKVVFCDGAFCTRSTEYITPLLSFAPKVEFEVIGNIHDNPELMEATNEN